MSLIPNHEKLNLHDKMAHFTTNIKDWASRFDFFSKQKDERRIPSLFQNISLPHIYCGKKEPSNARLHAYCKTEMKQVFYKIKIDI